MKRTFSGIILITAFILLLTGCSDVESMASNVNSIIKGNVTGELDRTYSTQWFDFNIKDIRVAYEYGDYEAYEGYKYVIVTVIETNTFDRPIPMYSSDFMINADGLAEEDTYPYEPFDDKMMPEEFELAIGETVEYYIIYGIPDEIVDISLVYVEIDEYDNIGATFTINHSLSLHMDELE